MADDSKTEKATPKKRRDERKKGNVFLSKDAVAVATLIAGILVLRVTFLTTVTSLDQFFQYCFTLARDNPAEDPPASLLAQVVSLIVSVTGPILGVVSLAAIAATFAQTRMLVAGELLKPKLDRISPLSGFKRLFSLKSVIEALKGLLKIIVLMAFIFTCLRDLIMASQVYLYADVTGSCKHLLDAIFSMLVKVTAAFIVLAALDFMYQWWDYERQMRMSKQEIKEEYKQTEGDPQVKGKIKEVQRRMAQSRMMQQVPQADVIVRNPTHFAVALRYHAGEDEAPVVLAKGQDSLALRIVKVAEEHKITVIENVPLARALYANTELNRQIPPDLYEAVAEVMVYLYKLGRLKGKSGTDGPIPS